MKLLVSYSNCQAWGILHFLRKTKIAEQYEFLHYDNFRIILKEQSSADLFEAASRCDVFLYQHTPAIKYCDLSTEEMIDKIVPKSALKLSFGYGFNHGFFPLVHHGQWQTAEGVKDLARKDPKKLLEDYDNGLVNFDCMGRFVACLNEQRDREERDQISIRMAGFIFESYQRHQLFICENHPASAYFYELSWRVGFAISGEMLDMQFSSNNDANLPCGLLVHPAAVNELGLEYAPEDGAQKFFKDYLQRLIAEP